MEGKECCIQKHILVYHITREEKVAIWKAGRTKSSKLANMLTGISHSDPTVLDVVTINLKSSIAFETKSSENFSAAHIVSILKDMMGSKILIGTSEYSSTDMVGLLK